MTQPAWSGFLRLSLVSCLIHLKPAINTGLQAKLRRLNAATGKPLLEGYIDPLSRVAVPPGATALGIEYEPGSIVRLDGDIQLEKRWPASVVEIEYFVAPDAVDRLYLDTPHYLYPDGELAAETLAAIRAAMRRTGQVGIGHMVVDGRERFVLLESRGAGLLLTTLRSPEAIEAAEFPEGEMDIREELVDVAEGIVARRYGSFDPSLWSDPYEGLLRARVAEAKNAVSLPEGAAPVQEASPAETASEPSDAAELVNIEEVGATATPVSPMVATLSEPEPTPAHHEHVIGPDATLDAPPEADPREPPVNGVDEDLQFEVLIQITGSGERRFMTPAWAGQPGGRQTIEAISIRGPASFPPDALEFRVFGPGGRATPWARNGSYAGTWGRQLLLTGFAVRPTQNFALQFDVEYQGSFFEAGVVGLKQNGERCISPISDDPLEAVLVHIRPRSRAAAE